MPSADRERSRVDRSAAEALEALTVAMRTVRWGDADGPRATPGAANGAAEQSLLRVVEPVQAELAGVTRGLGEVTAGLGSNTRALGGVAEGLAGALRGAVGALSRGLVEGGGIGSLLKGGFGLGPLAGAIVGMLRGGERGLETTLAPFSLPSPLHADRANGPLPGLAPVAREAGDGLRRVSSRMPASEITVNIQALDSQSFMDRSHDIARAVRDAMLHMHPVNDVIDEL